MPGEVESRLMFGGRRPRRTGMSVHFMQMVARHGERVARWQADRGKPYWRRAKRSTDYVPRLGVRERAVIYARQNRCTEAQASVRASAAEGLVVFHHAERARKGLLRLGFTPAQARNLIKRAPHGKQGNKPTHTEIDGRPI